jgi:hypothetical protein
VGPRPTGQSQGEGERRRRPQLIGGEVSGQAKVIMWTTSISRTRWHTRDGQRSSKGPVAAAHGGTVARVVIGRPSPTMIRSPKGCSSTGESRRTRRARKKGKRWSEEEWPTERKSSASSAMLWRAIPIEGGLTMGNWCEHGLREGEAELGARWSGSR